MVKHAEGPRNKTALIEIPSLRFYRLHNSLYNSLRRRQLDLFVSVLF